MESKELINNPLKKGKSLLLFDIDGTLTEARKSIKENMIEYFKKYHLMKILILLQ